MKLLSELLIIEAGKESGGILSGVEGLVDKAKKGYKDAETRLKDKQAKRKEAEKEAEDHRKNAAAEAEKAAKAANKAQGHAEKEEAEISKTETADHMLTTAESIAQLHREVDKFVQDFFDDFPFYGGPGGAEDVLKKYPTREAAIAAFKAFKGISDRLEQLRKGFNTSLAAAGKVTQEQTRRYEARADEFIGANAKPLPKEIINFVKSESKFFKRLIHVNDDFKLDDVSFKELMQLKIKQTDPARVPDAAEYLNILLAYAADEFRGHAKIIADVGRNLPVAPKPVRGGAKKPTTTQPTK